MSREVSSQNTADAAEELAEARRAADRERRKADAFAGMSHEIRTLLTGVIGCTQLLLDTELSGEQRDYAKRIRGSGDALLALINNILDFTKMDAGKLTLERADIDVRRVLEDVGELLAERALTRGIELVVAVDVKVPATLRGDPARLRQVALNLISNAIKFTERGEVVVCATIVEEAPEEVLLRFEVCDTGIGITPEGLARLFQPFSQDVGAARYGGSGLGLAIAKGLVEAMGGKIGCESEQGRGSRFFATIRFGKRRNERAPIPRIDLATRRVLVVEDNSAAAAVALSMLESIGVEARAAGDGAEALGALRAGAAAGSAFDVALIDASLPDVEAPELCDAVRGDESLAATRLVLMAYPGARVHAAALAATLPKPLRYSQLTTCLFTLLGSHVERFRTPSRGRLAAVRPAAPAEPEPAPKDRPCVLVVEDNVVNQKVARFMLEKRGYQCEVVDGGLGAVEALRKRAFALILMDCQMPKLDGYQTTEAIRALEGSERRTPIVAMTANVGAGARERCLDAGMDDYLSKPMVPEELDRALRRWSPTIGREARNTPVSVVPVRRPTPGPMPASTRTPNPASLDASALARLRMVQREGEPDLVAEVVALFLADAPRRVDAIVAAAGAGDSAALERSAHTLKGSARQIGAVALADACERLEDLGREGRADAANLASMLPAELERLARALRREGLSQ